MSSLVSPVTNKYFIFTWYVGLHFFTVRHSFRHFQTCGSLAFFATTRDSVHLPPETLTLEEHNWIAFRHNFEGQYTTEKKYLSVEVKSRSHFKNKGTSAIPPLAAAHLVVSESHFCLNEDDVMGKDFLPE